MSVVVMIKCDNPDCEGVGRPEEGGTTKKPRPPYGWLTIDGGWNGRGPYFKQLTVDSIDCVAAALEELTQGEN